MILTIGLIAVLSYGIVNGFDRTTVYLIASWFIAKILNFVFRYEIFVFGCKIRVFGFEILGFEYEPLVFWIPNVSFCRSGEIMVFEVVTKILKIQNFATTSKMQNFAIIPKNRKFRLHLKNSNLCVQKLKNRS